MKDSVPLSEQQCKDQVAKEYGYKNWNEIAARIDCDEIINSLLELYASQFKSKDNIPEPDSQWISVYDKKPEVKGYYLAVELDRSETPFVAFYNTVEWRSNDGVWAHPTHWMPLPSSPSKESN